MRMKIEGSRCILMPMRKTLSSYDILVHLLSSSCGIYNNKVNSRINPFVPPLLQRVASLSKNIVKRQVATPECCIFDFIAVRCQAPRLILLAFIVIARLYLYLKIFLNLRAYLLRWYVSRSRMCVSTTRQMHIQISISGL